MSEFLGKSGNRTLVQVKLTEPIARDIRDFSLFPEAEVILPPNVYLKKVGVFPAGHGLEIIQLEQTATVDPLLDMTPPSTQKSKVEPLPPITKKKFTRYTEVNCCASAPYGRNMEAVQDK